VTHPALLHAPRDPVTDLPAPIGEPVFPAYLGVFTASRFPLLAKFAKFPVSIQFVLEFAHYDFGHQRVVEKSQTGDLVRDQVIGFREVTDGGKDTLAIFLFQRPFLVLQQGQHGTEIRQALAHVVGRFRLLRLLQ
jgi:hypothetical protein